MQSGTRSQIEIIDHTCKVMLKGKDGVKITGYSSVEYYIVEGVFIGGLVVADPNFSSFVSKESRAKGFCFRETMGKEHVLADSDYEPLKRDMSYPLSPSVIGAMSPQKNFF